MPEFHHVDRPVLFPTLCYFCTAHTGPMIDTHRQQLGHGHVYVCDLCVTAMTRLMGGLDATEVQKLRDEIALRDEVIEGLREALELERANKVVTLRDVQEMFGPETRRPEPEPKPKRQRAAA